jgi:mannose-6-phosphate isomerase-like protein (cupin superfamily)
MTTPFHPAEYNPDGMTVQEIDFLASAIRTTPFRATHVVVKAGGRSPIDKHAVTECWLVASGTATMRLGDDSFTVAPGDVVTIASHIPHQAFNDTDQDFVFFSLWWNTTELTPETSMSWQLLLTSIE